MLRTSRYQNVLHLVEFDLVVALLEPVERKERREEKFGRVALSKADATAGNFKVHPTD